MSILKKCFFWFMLLGALSITACGDDDDCTAPALEENIVGTWELSSGGIVTFNADGSLDDPDDSVVGFPSTQDEEKTYIVTGMTIEVTAEADGGAGTLTADLEVTDNQCDSFQASFFGVTVTFERQ